jgi:hypothetical protein
MHRLLAFAFGVAVVVALRLIPSPAAAEADPLPGPTEVAMEVSRLVAKAPPGQGWAFADGQVDASEYRQAVAARVACVTADVGRAVEVIGPDPVAGGRLLTWRYRVSGDRNPAVALADRRCAFQHSAAIERAWRLTTVPQGSARRTETAGLALCLENLGVQVEDSGVRAVLQAAAEAPVSVAGCVDRHGVLFGL